MTVRPRLANLQIVFESFFEKVPLKIVFQSKEYITILGNNNFEIDEKSIDKNIEFQIKNFTNNNSSRVQIYFYIHGKKQRVDQSVFYPDNSESQIKKNLDTIREDGVLKIDLSTEWFACNIFDGSCIYENKSNFIHWVRDYKKKEYDRSRNKDLKNYDIACIGASATWGEGVNYNETWPYYLEKKMNIKCGNFGEDGIDHFTIIHNARYFLKNYKTKTLILQFGPYDFLLPKRDKINGYYVHHIVVEKNNHIKNNEYNLHIEKYKKWCLKKYHIIKKITSNKLISIKNFCDENKILLYVLYTDQRILKYDLLKENFLPLYINDYGKFTKKNYLNFALELTDILQRKKN
jgi:hypothetical protein